MLSRARLAWQSDMIYWAFPNLPGCTSVMRTISYTIYLGDSHMRLKLKYSLDVVLLACVITEKIAHVNNILILECC